MTALYLLGITTNKLRYAPGLDREDAGAVIRRQIEDIGGAAWYPIRGEFKRSGKNGQIELRQGPYLPGYLFAEVPAHVFHEVATLKGVFPTLRIVPAQERTGVMRFMEAAAVELQAMRQAMDDQVRRGKLIAEFRPGQALHLLSGPLAGFMAEFDRVVKTAASARPSIRVRVAMMGSVVPVDVDPLAVEAAE